MLTLQIQNKEIDDIFINKFQSNKDKLIDFITYSLKQSISNKEKIKYAKKNPLDNIKQLKYQNNNEKLSNPFADITDIKAYSKNLRDNSWR
ncbi:MAG: hypothetical protein DRQ51_08145 [Gammaproteobacteria bacterium]|nr:MAG: hypothetical protein DRQ51_08145 [Gammaproteobacteria bacterium]